MEFRDARELLAIVDNVVHGSGFREGITRYNRFDARADGFVTLPYGNVWMDVIEPMMMVDATRAVRSEYFLAPRPFVIAKLRDPAGLEIGSSLLYFATTFSPNDSLYAAVVCGKPEASGGTTRALVKEVGGCFHLWLEPARNDDGSENRGLIGAYTRHGFEPATPVAAEAFAKSERTVRTHGMEASDILPSGYLMRTKRAD